ncbi:MAG: tRNA (adenosine(37)-N6)-dimethylallyltransferase MiaA [bacterium]
MLNKELENNNYKIKKPKIIVILGPTASGKTSLAVQIAKEFNGEIVSADSRQVYKGMDLGTSKDLDEYNINGEKIPYNLIDVADPKEVFDLAQYQEMAFTAINNILSRGKLPIIVGGSGLYLQAIVDNYNLSNVGANKVLRKKLEKKDVSKILKKIKKLDQDFFNSLNNSQRNNKRHLIRYVEILKSKNKIGSQNESQYNSLIIGLTWPIDILRERIKQKLLLGLEQGMVEEVRNLHEHGLSWERLNSFGLEYRYIAEYLQGKLEYDEMVEKLNIAIRQFAKRQISWFRRWEKQGAKINWLSKDNITTKVKEFIG